MKLIVGNFKMNLLDNEVDEYVDFFKEKNYSNVYFAPSFIYLSKFVNNNLVAVSQDVSSYANGAYTGDVSAQELKSMGVNYSIVGHSERRKYYHDSKLVNEKIKRLLEEEMIPILCIGETREERDNNKEIEVIESELDEAFKDIDNNLIANIIIAYEPIWSIGTGIVPINEEIEEIILHIKRYVKSKYLVDVKVLYGGSVNNKCIGELEKIDIVDGYLVGGCSLKYLDFDLLINSIK